MFNIFKSIIKKFKTVYCEDCEYSFLQDSFWEKEKILACKKSLIKVDCTDKKDYITKKREKLLMVIKIVKM